MKNNNQNTLLETKYFKIVEEVQDLRKIILMRDEEIRTLKSSNRLEVVNDENTMVYDEVLRLNQRLKKDLSERTKEKEILQENMKKLLAKNDHLNMEYEKRGKSLRILEEEIENLKVEAAVIEERWSRMNFDKADLLKQIEDLKGELEKERLESLSVMDNFRSCNDSLGEDLRQMESDSFSENERSTCSRDLPEADQNKYDEHLKTIEILNEKLNSEICKTKESNKSKQKLLGEIDFLRNEINDLRRRPDLVRKLSKVQSTLALNRSSMSLQQEQNEQLKKEISMRDSKIEDFRKSMNSLEFDLELLKNQDIKNREEINKERELHLATSNDLYFANSENKRLKNELEMISGYLKEAEDDKQELEDLHNNFKTQKAEEIKILEDRLEEKDEELQNFKRTTLKNEEILKGDIEYFQQKIAGLTLSLKKEQKERNELEQICQEKNNLEYRLSELRAEYDCLQKNFQTMSEINKELENDNKTLSDKFQDSEEYNFQLKEQNEKLKTRFNSEIKDLESTVESLTSRNEELVKTRYSLQNELSSIKEEIEELIKDNEEYVQEKEKDSEIILSLRHELNAKTSAFIELGQEKHDLEKENRNLKSTLADTEFSLKRSNDKLTNESQQHEEAMKSLYKKLEKVEQDNLNFNKTLRKQENIRKELSHQLELAKTNEQYTIESNERKDNIIKNLKAVNNELEEDVARLKMKMKQLI